jgi:hypothetical protein
MPRSLSGKLGKTTRDVILMAALFIPSYGGVVAAQSAANSTVAAKQSPNTPPAPKAAASKKPSNPPSGASSQCSDSCCSSPEAQIELAHNAAAKDAADAQNRAIQTQAGIDAAEDAADHAADMEQKAITVFCKVFLFTGILLVLMLAAVGISLATGKWSLREALSEKSSVHPKEGAATLIPSTSRFIALFGLLGIVTILLGIGYAIIWNLLIYHKPPDSLSEINSFLLGAASLFAPYIANQLRVAFTSPPGDKSTEKAAPTEQHEKPAAAPAAKS